MGMLEDNKPVNSVFSWVVFVTSSGLLLTDGTKELLLFCTFVDTLKAVDGFTNEIVSFCCAAVVAILTVVDASVFAFVEDGVGDLLFFSVDITIE